MLAIVASVSVPSTDQLVRPSLCGFAAVMRWTT